LSKLKRRPVMFLLSTEESVFTEKRRFGNSKKLAMIDFTALINAIDNEILL